MRRLVAVVAFALVVSCGSVASDAPAESRHDKLLELIQLTGGGDQGVQMLRMVVEPVRSAMTQVPPEWWDSFVAKVDTDELVELVIPAYDERLTDGEIDAMLEFYRTPEAQSIVGKLPGINQEAMMAGQSWASGVARELISDLEAAGHEVPPQFRM
jgi:hypothetical protein